MPRDFELIAGISVLLWNGLVYAVILLSPKHVVKQEIDSRMVAHNAEDPDRPVLGESVSPLRD